MGDGRVLSSFPAGFRLFSGRGIVMALPPHLIVNMVDLKCFVELLYTSLRYTSESDPIKRRETYFSALKFGSYIATSSPYEPKNEERLS